jgi:hypothetical protein
VNGDAGGVDGVDDAGDGGDGGGVDGAGVAAGSFSLPAASAPPAMASWARKWRREVREELEVWAEREVCMCFLSGTGGGAATGGFSERQMTCFRGRVGRGGRK